MNKFLPIIFLLFFGTKIQAQHQEILGSHISYHAIDTLTYEVKLTVIRDCSGDLPSLNDTLILRSGNYEKKQKAKLVSVDNITPYNQNCEKLSSCLGQKSNFGIQERIYLDTFRLDSVKNCDVYFEWTGNKRYSKITTGSSSENHYNYAYLNYCATSSIALIDENKYFKGELFFKVSDTSSIVLPNYNGSYNGTYPYIQDVITLFNITKIERPFLYLNTAASDRIYSAEFNYSLCPKILQLLMSKGIFAYAQFKPRYFTQGGNGQNTSTSINSGIVNNSSLFTGVPNIVIKKNKELKYGIRCIDTNEFSDYNEYKLVKPNDNIPFKFSNDTTHYNQPYQFVKYQIGKGMTLDFQLNNIVFTPTEEDIVSYRIETDEFRYINGNKVKIGIVNWDMVFMVKNDTTDYPKMNVQYSPNFCVGIDNNIFVEIVDTTGNDSTKLSFDYLGYNGFFDSIFKKKNNENGNAKWNPSDKYLREKNYPHIVNISSSTNQCDNSLISINYPINISLFPDTSYFDLLKEKTSCNSVKWKIDRKKTFSDPHSVNFFEVDKNLNFNQSSNEIKYKKSGWKKEILTIKTSKGCVNKFIDSIFLDSVPEFIITKNIRDTICLGTSYQFTIDSIKVKYPNSLEIIEIDTINKLEILQYYKAILTDREGCFLRDSLPVLVLNPSIKKSKDTAICLGDSSKISAEILNAKSVDKYLIWNEKDTINQLNFLPKKDTTLYIKAPIGEYCTLYDSVKIKVNKLPEFLLKDSIFCGNTDAVLNIEIKEENKAQQIFWNKKSAWNTYKIPHENIPLLMKIKVKDTLGCVTEKLHLISTFFTSKLKLDIQDSACFNDSFVDLIAIPEGGIWKGNAIENDVFYPKKSTDENNKIEYYFTDKNNCKDSAEQNLFLKFVKEPEIFVSTNQAEITTNIYFKENSSENFDAYFWDISNEKNQYFSSKNNDSLLLNETGFYDINLKVEKNGCTNFTALKNAFEILPKDNANILFSFKKSLISIYPNPAKSELFFQNSTAFSILKYKITDINGKIILKGNTNKNNTSVNIETLSQGIYLIEISTNEMMIEKLKFVKY